ncbi:hypothetical protein ALP71_05798 [Pseudomonas coronafaciens pv. garcae]|nr:hypothetical protein ALP71_05798 [Pseudomonas coronafaciens pv. garcae]
MAGNGHGKRVGTTSVGHSTNGAGHTYLRGDLRVSDGRSGRYAPQCLPYPLLKHRATNVQRQRKAGGRRLYKAHDLGNQRFELRVCTDKVGVWEPVLKTFDKHVGIISERNGADTFAAGRHQNRTQRALTQGEPDIDIGAACTVFGRFHAEHILRSLIETTVGVVARFVERTGDRRIIGQPGLQTRAHRRLPIGLWCQPGQPFEHPVKMKSAHADLFGKLGQIGHCYGAVQQSAGFGNGISAFELDRLLIAAAAPRRTKTGDFGLARGVKKHHVFWTRKPGRAARLAVDTSGQYAVNEIRTDARAPLEQNVPAWIVFRAQGMCCVSPLYAVHLVTSPRVSPSLSRSGLSDTPMLAFKFEISRLCQNRSVRATDTMQQSSGKAQSLHQADAFPHGPA